MTAPRTAPRTGTPVDFLPVPEGNALVYCAGSFGTPNGKTAHGLVRFTRRYRILAVIDPCHAGEDAGLVLDGKRNGIPVYASVDEALSRKAAENPTHLVVGLAPDGGRLGAGAREDLGRALSRGLNVDCGLHDFLGDDPELSRLAALRGVSIRDVRKPPPRGDLHFFSGKIAEVRSLRIAILGTDSAVGKRTTAWILVQALAAAGHRSELIGTGQTAWMQGARYGIILDSLVNDFVSGEIEHAIWTAWQEVRPEVLVIEGQGSLMNPAYPGGFEILAAGRPDLVILQHAPARKDYDGLPGHPIHPLPRQIQAIQVLSDIPVVAITVNHEGLSDDEVGTACEAIRLEVGVPAFDVLGDGPGALVDLILPHLPDGQAP